MPIAAKISSYVLPLFSEHLSYSRVSNHVWNPEQIIHQMTIYTSMIDSSTVEHAIASKGF